VLAVSQVEHFREQSHEVRRHEQGAPSFQAQEQAQEQAQAHAQEVQEDSQEDIKISLLFN
jgi:hypothetical protein